MICSVPTLCNAVLPFSLHSGSTPTQRSVNLVHDIQRRGLVVVQGKHKGQAAVTWAQTDSLGTTASVCMVVGTEGPIHQAPSFMRPCAPAPRTCYHIAASAAQDLQTQTLKPTCSASSLPR